MARVRYMNREQKNIYNLSQFPNFHISGSIKGMKDKYYGQDALLVKSGSYIYHVPAEIYYCAH